MSVAVRSHAALAAAVMSLCGCSGSGDVTDASGSNPSGSASDAPMVTTPVAECDPAVTVPGPFGAPSDAVADPDQPVFGAAPEPFHVRYAWPGSDPSQSAGFLWRTDVDTLATEVQYGVGADLDEAGLTLRAVGASYRFGGTVDAPGPARVHEVKLCSGLAPATRYSYRVGGDGHWSPIYTFTTPGEPGSFDTFRIGFAGDARGAYETWGTVLAAIDAEDPDLILFTGDMIDFGTNQAEWDAWLDATGDVLARRPLLAAHGNHEFLAVHYFAQWMFPGNEQWYTVRFGDLTLVALNDTVVDRDQIADQAAYLDAAFAANPAPWRVAFHHQGVYATCHTHGSNLDLREQWAPVYDRNDVQLVLNGHNHVYERSVPIRGDAEVASGDGTVYITAGGAGADLYTAFDEDWFGEVALSTEHYVIGDFGPTEASFVVRDLTGNVIDSFVVPR